MSEIKQGYKQSKVGIIPEDWEVVKLNEKSSIQRGRFSPRPRNDPQFYNGDYPFVQTNDVVNSKGKITTYSQTLNEKGLKVSKLFPQGTILMTIAANIGFTGILTRDMTCPDSLVGIQCKKGLFNEFLNFYFIFNQKRIDYLAEEAAQKNINLSTLNSFHIPLPPLKEQEKIAEILTTWDEAITKQTELLEAKELLKIALMQKLLSGEVRFDGFDDEWEEVRLGEICEIKKGEQLNKDTLDSDGDFPVINGGIEPSGYTEEWNTEANTITISEGGNSCGYVNFLQENFWSGGHCYTLLNLQIDKIFLYQFLKYNQHNIMKLRVGSGLPNIQKSAIEKFTINKPSFGEQQKIAEVLSLADEEINLLKNELEELKQQKKALMQKLLTGQVRVKVC